MDGEAGPGDDDDLLEMTDFGFRAVLVDGGDSEGGGRGKGSTIVDLVRADGCGCITKRSGRKKYSALPMSHPHLHSTSADGESDGFGSEGEVAQGPCGCGCADCGANEDGICRCAPGHGC